MHRISKALLIIFIILVLITITAVSLIIIVSKKDTPIQEKEEAKLFLRGNAELKYALESEGITVKTGEITKDTWREIPILFNKTYNVWCWNDEFYVNGVEFTTNSENEYNIECASDRIGELTISANKNITELGYNYIKVNISSLGQSRKLFVCERSSIGISEVSFPVFTTECNGNSWKNYTEYYEENESYNYLEEGKYFCPSEKRIEECQEVGGATCYVGETEIPKQYKGRVDTCYNIGESLEDEDNIFEITIRTNNAANYFDYVTLYVFDHDRRKVNDEKYWSFHSEYDRKNMGIKEDIEVTMPYIQP